MRTWVSGELVVASYMNGNIRDLGNFLLARPMAIIRQTVAQSVPNASWTPVTFDTEDLDRDNGHSTVTNTSRYTAATPGYYWISAQLPFVTNTTGIRGMRFRTNGVDVPLNGHGRILTNTTLGGNDTSMSSSGAQYLNGTSDYMELICYQNSGGALNLLVDNSLGPQPRFQLLWATT